MKKLLAIIPLLLAIGCGGAGADDTPDADSLAAADTTASVDRDTDSVDAAPLDTTTVAGDSTVTVVSGDSVIRTSAQPDPADVVVGSETADNGARYLLTHRVRENRVELLSDATKLAPDWKIFNVVCTLQVRLDDTSKAPVVFAAKSTPMIYGTTYVDVVDLPPGTQEVLAAGLDVQASRLGLMMREHVPVPPSRFYRNRIIQLAPTLRPTRPGTIKPGVITPPRVVTIDTTSLKRRKVTRIPVVTPPARVAVPDTPESPTLRVRIPRPR